MSTQMIDLDALVAEIKALPKFTAAVEKDGVRWTVNLDDIVRGLDLFGRWDDGAAIELSDRLATIINDKSLTLKARLLSVAALAKQFFDDLGQARRMN